MYYEPSYYVYAAIVFVYYGVRFFGSRLPTILLSVIISSTAIVIWQFYIVCNYGPADILWLGWGLTFIGKSIIPSLIGEILFRATLGRNVTYHHTRKDMYMLFIGVPLGLLFSWNVIQLL